MSVTDTGAADIYNVDTNDVGDTPAPQDNKKMQPVYRIYEGSRIAISSNVGKYWQRKIQAAIKAYEPVAIVWDETFKYYNNNHSKAIESSRGIFKRGDGTENVVYSNLNIMLPAVYSKDPDITCSTVDESEAPFCKTLETLLNTQIRQKLNAKPRIKKAVGIGLLTNFGILKLDYTRKDDSREIAVQQMTTITVALAKAKTQAEVEQLYGQLEALEMNMEVMRPSGPSLANVLPHNLIVDPYAELQDGTDAEWMAERVHLQTECSLSALRSLIPRRAMTMEAIPTHIQGRACLYTSRPTKLRSMLLTVDATTGSVLYSKLSTRAYRARNIRMMNAQLISICIPLSVILSGTGRRDVLCYSIEMIGRGLCGCGTIR